MTTTPNKRPQRKSTAAAMTVWLRFAPERGDIESFFDLQALDDELSFGLTDLRRHPPRSPFDLSAGV